MSRLILFAWVNSGCKERTPRITKWKILALTGTRTHDPWFSSLVPNPLGLPIWYTNENLKLIQYNTGVHCAIYSYILPYETVFLFCHVFRSHMKWMSFRCLTNRYWSNSKMTSISNNYNTKYTTKWKHALALYGVAINCTMHTCILLDNFWILVCISDWVA